MAKNLDSLPIQFKELGRALEGDDLGGWSIASAEGGWITPTREEWVKFSEGEDDALAETQTGQSAAKAAEHPAS